MNAFFKIKAELNIELSIDKVLQSLAKIMPDKMYSYLLIQKDDYYKCDFTVATTDKYNIIDKNTAITDIVSKLNIEKVIFAQPSLEIMIEVFTPFIQSLVNEQHMHWQYLEYEDLLQLCYLSLCKLYRKGYYLNNLILRTTFIRDVLLSIRKNRTDYKLISLDNTYGKDDSLHIEDSLEDISYTNEQYDKEHSEEILYIFNEVKDIIVGIIGERRFEQLYREYKDKTTTNAMRQTLTRIKREFNKRGLNIESFRR